MTHVVGKNMITITLRELKAPPAPCAARFNYLLEWLGHYDLDRPIDLTDILRHNGLSDTEWVINNKLPALREKYQRGRAKLDAKYCRERDEMAAEYGRECAALVNKHERLSAYNRQSNRQNALWDEYQRQCAALIDTICEVRSFAHLAEHLGGYYKNE